ncbi:MAG: exodeoxyribonuclease III [Candidatus Pacebacteria bacterium]|nr:exodeoxyribonuclease III [Candidatus Paceibacterota bacterium]
MKIISWNVNGIRAWQEKEGTLSFISQESPDILCFQEIKAREEDMNLGLFAEYQHVVINSAEKRGYSGTAVFSKIQPLSIAYGIKNSTYDTEGRVITMEFENFFLVNVYTPNSKPDLSRLDFRYDNWDREFLKHLKKLETKKPVITCGDFNAAHTNIDIARPDANRTTSTKPGTAGFTDKEREGVSNLIGAGFIDSYRALFPEKIQYTWWSYRAFARERNVGWRIDYFFVSSSLKEKLQSATIHDGIKGSDHCPISIQIKI